MYNIDLEKDGYIHYNDYDEAINALFKRVGELNKRVNSITPEIFNNTEVNNITNNFESLNYYLDRKYRYILTRNYYNNVNTENYTTLQSSAEDEDYFYLAYMPYTFLENSSKIDSVKIDKISKVTGNITHSNIIANGGHANGLTYNKFTNKLYLAVALLDDGTHNNYILEVNPSDLTVTRTITTNHPGETKCIAFNENTDTYLIGSVSGAKFYELDENFNDIRQININDWGNVGVAHQDIDIFNNLIYCLSSDQNCITIFDLDGNYLYSNSYITQAYTIGELEGISHFGNSQHVTSMYIAGQYAYQEMCQIWDVKKGSNNYNKQNGNRYPKTLYRTRKLYVDITSNDNNPDGTIDRPFQEIWEAIDVCQGENANAVILVKNGNYHTVTLFEGARCLITYYDADNTDIYVNGVYVADGASLTLYHMKIYNSNKGLQNGSIVSTSGVLNLFDVEFDKDIKCDYNGTVNLLKDVTSIHGAQVVTGIGGFIYCDNPYLREQNLLAVKGNYHSHLFPRLTLYGDNEAHSITTYRNTHDQIQYFAYATIVLVYNGTQHCHNVPTRGGFKFGDSTTGGEISISSEGLEITTNGNVQLVYIDLHD